MRRRYIVAVYDVTDLDEDEENGLAGEINAQAEPSGSHRSVGVVIGSAVEAGDDVQHVGLFVDAGVEVGVVVKPSTVPVLDLSNGVRS